MSNTSMQPVVFSVPGNEPLARRLSDALGAEPGACLIRTFPDGEVYVRVDTPVAGRPVILACTLHHPQDRLLALLFLAATCRDLGASEVGLVAPYLAFMRQDERFRPGEGITSIYFAEMLSRSLSWLVTVDPHLHRWHALDQIYTIPTRVAHAAHAIAGWLRDNVPAPVLVGPDAESEQWVSAVAAALGAPHVILTKTRHGDHDVEITAPDLTIHRGATPVLLDDIVSTGRTMIEAAGHLERAGLARPVCVCVHAVFSGDAYDELRASMSRVVSCNTIAHESNAIAVDDAVIEAVRAILA
jgi:ribose-phosphate pyrophosphokinase